MVLSNISEDSNYSFLFFAIIYSHLNFVLDIRLNSYIDLMNSVIKHVITVGLDKIKTNNKGKELNSLIMIKHIDTIKTNRLQKH